MKNRRRTGPSDEPVTIVPKHHPLVRWTHWLNVPLLFGLIASGLSIYWAAPVFQHPRDPVTGSREYLQDAGLAIANLLRDRGGGNWIYDHFSLGTRQLAIALRIHWALAYLFMLNGLLYFVGLALGGGWRALVPRRSDLAEAFAMIRFYLGVVPMRLLRRPWPHPPVRAKYNALQRAGYAAMSLFGGLAVLSGWAMHQPAQLGWLERAFGSYEGARVVHFASMLVLGSFVVPHVILVAADGWDTFRSMVVGWSKRTQGAAYGGRMEPVVNAPASRLRSRSRRDFLLFGAGLAATATGAWWLLPDGAKARLAPGRARERLDAAFGRAGLTRARRERALNLAIDWDDRVAATLYSPHRRVRTYRREDVTPLRNNYHGRTPGPGILDGWALEISGLASGRTERLDLEAFGRFAFHEQITRLVCVEGWSAVAWWGGVRFADLLDAFPPAEGARWAALRSEVSLDARGRPEPYYVSFDLATARHPQTLLATRHDGRTLTLAHGAPLRLLAPTKLGLKNIKALTHVAYVREEPPDYWHERGYSSFDGL